MKVKILLIALTVLMSFSCSKKSSDNVIVKQQEETPSGEYRIGLFKDTAVDFQKITHIIVVGSAVNEDSDQFFQSGLGRAERYKEQWPDHQVIIMSSPDVKNMTDEQVFAKYKIPVVKHVNKKFNANLLLDEMSQFSQIASFDFYGHASPWAMIIGKTHAAFDPSAHYARLKKLRANFVGDAYATLNACNTGFYLAPDLSLGLAIPVSGSLTSSLFEQIQSDGFWYKEDDYDAPKNYVNVNRFSYKSHMPCELGFCTRMKSSRKNYSSFWGTFDEGGLSFDKFFCNYENNQDGRCERGMAMSLMSFPSVLPINLNAGEEDFKSVVYDWLCSTGTTKDYFTKCVNGIEGAIERGDLLYQSHPGNELNCDFASCNAKIVCKYKSDVEGPEPGSCKLDTIPNQAPTNAAREYLSFMKGFKAIKQ